MTGTFTRRQRRQMQRLADEANQAVEADRRYFERHAGRTYRVRLISPAERKQVEIIQGRPVLADADQAVFVAIKQLATGVRFKVTVLGPRESIGEELTDAEACSIYESYCNIHPDVRAKEVALRAAVARQERSSGRPGDATA